MAKQLAIEIFLVALVGLLLGVIGPFGTFEVQAALRIGYWVIFGLVGYAIFRPLTIVGRWLSEMLNIAPLIGIGFALVLAAMPMTLIVAMILFRFDLGKALGWPGLGQLYFQVWLIGFLTNGFFTLLFRDREEAAANDRQVVAPPNGWTAEPEKKLRFEERLPPGFGPLLALKGEDHYVRAIGETREELVLIRMRDAISELVGIDGLAVHRSWWVARAAVKTVRRDGRAMVLTLSNGSEVPVARDATAKLRNAGWLQ
jgi:hypothetical protein